MNVFFLTVDDINHWVRLVALDASNQMWVFKFDYKTDIVQKLDGSDPISALSKYSVLNTFSKLASAPEWDFFVWNTASSLTFENQVITFS